MQIKGAEEIAAEGNPQITPLPTLTYPPKPTEKFRSKDGWSRFSKIKKGGGGPVMFSQRMKTTKDAC